MSRCGCVPNPCPGCTVSSLITRSERNPIWSGSEWSPNEKVCQESSQPALVWKRSPALRNLIIPSSDCGVRACSCGAGVGCPTTLSDSKAGPPGRPGVILDEWSRFSTATPEATNPEPPVRRLCCGRSSAWKPSSRSARPDRSSCSSTASRSPRRSPATFLARTRSCPPSARRRRADPGPSRSGRLRRLLLGLSGLRTLLGDFGADLFHVQFPGLLHDLLEHVLRQGARLGKQQHLVPEDHQGRDAADVEGPGQLLLLVGIDLGEGDVEVGLGDPLVYRGECTAGPTPGRPPVDQHDAALLNGRLEIVLGDRHHSHVRLLRYGEVIPRAFSFSTSSPAASSSSSSFSSRSSRTASESRSGCSKYWST